MNEQMLRDLLHAAAAREDISLLDDGAAADAVIKARRTQSRQWIGMAAAAACVLLVVVLVPQLIRNPPQTPEGEAAEQPAAVLGWPTRGSLADDEAAVEAVRGLRWHVDPGARERERVVLFLGDVPGGRRALVVAPGAPGTPVLGPWFSGPPGSDPGDLEVDGATVTLEDAESVSHLDGSGRTLVVLAEPDATVEMSLRVDVGTDGSVRRSFVGVDTRDGVAVTPVDSTTEYGSAVAYRVIRHGEVVDRGQPYPPFEPADVFDPPPLTPTYPSPAAPVPEAIDLAIGQVALETGVGQRELGLELLWAGPIGTDSTPADAVVLAATLPNGAVVVSTAWARMQEDGSGSAGTCGAQSHPAGTPLATLAVGVRCRIHDPATADGRPVLLLVTPPSVSEAVLLSADGTTRNFVDVGPGGISMSPPPPGADRVRFEGAAAGPVEQAVVESPEGWIVDRAGRRAED